MLTVKTVEPQQKSGNNKNNKMIMFRAEQRAEAFLSYLFRMSFGLI